VGAPDAGVLEIDPIGRVEGGRGEPVDDDWGDVEAAVDGRVRAARRDAPAGVGGRADARLLVSGIIG
jgi:hypothetical protein